MSHGALFLVLACSLAFPTTAAAQGEPAALDPVIAWGDPLVLEETDATLAVRPRLRADPRGGFILIDPQAAQFRTYDEAGDLRAHFGRRGEGPGEFRRLRTAFRAGSALYALDADGRLSRWDEGGGLVDDRQLPVRNVLSAGAVSDSTIMVVTGPSFASPKEYDSRLVRLIDLGTRTEIAADVALPIRPDNLMAVATIEGSGPSDPRARAALTWPVFDTIWVAEATNRTVKVAAKIAIDSRALEATGPAVDRRADPDGFSDWMASASLAGEAFPVPDGGWLVVIVKPGGGETRFGLVRLDARGTRLWEIHGGPLLMMVHPESGLLYFREPSQVRPNVFLRGRLRPGS